MVFDAGQFDIEFLRPGHDVFYGLQLGHIKTGLLRHWQIDIAAALPSLLTLSHRPAHTALAPVIGCQCQVPIAKHLVQFLQVVQRRPGRGKHIAAVVPKHVLAQFVLLASSWHELPHAHCLGRGHCLGIEGTLHKRQQCQLAWHVAALKLFNNMKQVFVGALGHAHQVVGPGAVPLFAPAHQISVEVGHAKPAADTLPQVDRCSQARDSLTLHLNRRDQSQLGGRRWAVCRCFFGQSGLPMRHAADQAQDPRQRQQQIKFAGFQHVGARPCARRARAGGRTCVGADGQVFLM